MHILNMPMEPQVNDKALEPTEKAQIVIHYTCPHPSLVVRYDDVKTAKKDYEALCKRRKTYPNSKEGCMFEFSNSKVMFQCQLDISYIASVMFIDHAKRNKFVPIP